MRNTVFGINTTLDGCCSHTELIADDELHEYFTELLRNADIALFGRNTYQLMFPYWHTVAENQSATKATNEFARTIDAINKIVFSKTLKSVEMKNTTLSRANIEEELLKLKGQPGKDIFIDGLSIAAHLAQLGMIDEYHVLVQPIVAGKGPHLFEAGSFKERLQLKLVGSKKFGSGVIALHYKKTAP
jgi:dihydrofolate reductase